MSKRIEDLKIVSNRFLNDEYFILTLSSASKLPVMYPGQFAQVKVDGSPDTFLRRPISIHDVDYGTNTFRVLIQILGKGTETLSRLKPGDQLNLIYPLGNSFTMPETSGGRVLLVGGGCGIAPLLFLGKELKSLGFEPEILLGFRTRERVLEVDEYLKVGRVFLTTEDGSVGEKGYVTAHSLLKEASFSAIYCCGPEPMMKAVAKYAMTMGIECEASLENLMACGIGVCLCCIVSTDRGNVCTCTDGPVFNVKDLKW